MWDRFWQPVSHQITQDEYKSMQRGALKELKYAITSEHKPILWTEGVNYEDLIRVMNLFKEENYDNVVIDWATYAFIKYLCKGDIYRF